MKPLSVPEHALFRITLFFGPEKTGDDESRWRCVFNVKKRSWKGGVQVSVDISGAQVDRLVRTLSLAAWSSAVLAHLSDEERPVFRQRMEEVFIQLLCGRKLDLALQSGLEQHNQEISADALIKEVDDLSVSEREHLFASLRTELDLHDPRHPTR
jgi:hypothetical protein